MPSRTRALFVLLSLVMSSVVFAQDSGETRRTASGRPDLSGTYDVATLTPLERPAEFGDRLALTEEEAALLGQGGQAAVGQSRFNIPVERNVGGGAPTEAPPVGGDGSTSAAGNVGGYNSFWFDAGSGGFQVDGQWRTSIITDPANGQRPPLTPAAREQRRVVNQQRARHGLVDSRERAGCTRAVRRPRDSTAGRTVSGVRVDGRSTDASVAVQQPQAHRADR